MRYYWNCKRLLMTTNQLRIQTPMRTCAKTYAQYSSFRPYLQADFHNRCGYCDDADRFHGNSRYYQIDHFKPHSLPQFLRLKLHYSNLVYSCPFCNRAKSNKWENVSGFIDPCGPAYDNHLARNNKGQIISKSPSGDYMYQNLNLYLMRHELLRIIEILEDQKQKLVVLTVTHPKDTAILQAFMDIQIEIDNYTTPFM